MKQVWAPWRIEYILGPKPGECIFCTMPAEDTDRDNLILYRGERNFIIMNRYPYNSGHLMIVPYFHTSSFEGLDSLTLSEMMELTRASVECLEEVMRPEGFNTGLNIGQAAGAGIREHLHMHVVPRWAGDSNFMAALDEVRVIPEHLMSTYDKIHKVIGKHAQRTQG
ncbi:HIT domain-containing protein [Nitrospirota bacterium]